MDQSELRARLTQYYLVGRGLAELHATGMTLEGDHLLDPANFVVVSDQGDLRVSPVGMARIAPFNPTPANRAASMRPAVINVLKPFWDTIAAGYMEKAEKLGQAGIAAQALGILAPMATRAHEARLLQAESLKLSAAGKYAESVTTLQREIAILEELGATVTAGRLRVNLGSDYQCLGDEAAALANYTEAYTIAQRNDDSYGLVMACASLAMHHRLHGDMATASRYGQEGLDRLEDAGMPPADEKAIRQALMSPASDP